MAYITQAELQSKLGRELTTDEAAYFAATLLPAIQEFINDQTMTVFDNTTSSDVYVDGNGTKSLIIPTMSDVTSVYSVDDDGVETLIDSSAWTKYPRVGAVLAVRNKQGTWSEGVENYRVTGKLGFTTVPLGVKNLALEMAAADFNADGNVKNYKSERVGDWQVTYGDGDYSKLSTSSLTTIATYQRLSRSV